MPQDKTEPEILRPRSRHGADLFSDENLRHIAHVLDDFLRIPGTNIRFGLDGIVGLVPGIGDMLGAMASWIIILGAWLRGVPKITIARMFANVAIETVIGAIPLAGDAFDIWWKANQRNVALLERSVKMPKKGIRRDWAFLILLMIAMMALLVIPILVVAWLAGHFFAAGMRH